MKRVRLLLLLPLAVSLSCVDMLQDRDSLDRGTAGVTQVVVTVTGGNRGGPEMANRVPFAPVSAPYTLHIEARGADGRVRADFNDFLELSAHPGELALLQGVGATQVAGRLVRLAAGVGDIAVTFSNSFGETRLWALENGYIPVPPDRANPPACANGRDDDGDGRTDFPADFGCAAPNDDSEVGGSGSLGASEPIYFSAPTIRDVNGIVTVSPLVDQRVTVTRGTVVITRVDNSGFWVTDVDPATSGGPDHPGASLYIFNFSAPAGLRPCDTLSSLQGTVQEFVGTTQLTQPSWLVAPSGLWVDTTTSGACPIPPAHPLTGDMLPTQDRATQALLEPWESSLVRAVDLRLAPNFGVDHPTCGPVDPTDPMSPSACDFMPGRSNCDYSGDGVVDFGRADEALCANLCQTTVGCSEYNTWVRFQQYAVDFVTGQVNGTQRLAITPKDAFSSFDPRHIPAALTGTVTVTGVLTQVGPSWILRPRCTQDVVAAGQTPMPTNQSCITPRSIEEGP